MKPSPTLPWGHELLYGLAEAPAGRPAALLLRHSQRERLHDMHDAHLIPLTPEGEAGAREFGRQLPSGRVLRALHSPISRCAMTAERAVEGYRAAGGEAHVDGPLDELGGPYVLDLPATVQLSNELRERYPRAWFDGRLPPGVAMPRDEASALTIKAIAKILRGAPPATLFLLVTHDWNVLLVRESVLGLRFEDVGWVDYLDGLLMVPTDDGLEVSWRDHRRTVPAPTR